MARLDRQLFIAADVSLVRRKRTKAARMAAHLAERIGFITRPPRCSWCRRRLPLERHHEDYDEPLVVMFLCRSCHNLADGKASEQSA